MEFNKVTVGFVVQHFVEGPNGKCICDHQEFVGGDQISHENKMGEALDPIPDYEYQHFDMVQPSFECSFCFYKREREGKSIITLGEMEFCSDECFRNWKFSQQIYQ